MRRLAFVIAAMLSLAATARAEPIFKSTDTLVGSDFVADGGLFKADRITADFTTEAGGDGAFADSPAAAFAGVYDSQATRAGILSFNDPSYGSFVSRTLLQDDQWLNPDLGGFRTMRVAGQFTPGGWASWADLGPQHGEIVLLFHEDDTARLSLASGGFVVRVVPEPATWTMLAGFALVGSLPWLWTKGRR